MSRWALLKLGALTFLAGCASHPLVTPLSDGSQIIEYERMAGSWRERNASALARMAQHGDDCSKPRLIRHFVPGPINKLRRMKAGLPHGVRAALQMDPPNLMFPSYGRCSVEVLTRRGAEIDRLARPYGLSYDGWDVDHRP